MQSFGLSREYMHMTVIYGEWKSSEPPAAKVHLHGKWPLKVCVSSATGSQCSICRGGVGFNPTGWVEGYFLNGVQNFLVWNGSCLYVFPEQQNTPKTFDGRSFARDPTGAAYSDPSDPLAGQKGLTLTFCSQSCGLQITIPVFLKKELFRQPMRKSSAGLLHFYSVVRQKSV